MRAGTKKSRQNIIHLTHFRYVRLPFHRKWEEIDIQTVSLIFLAFKIESNKEIGSFL